MSEWRDIESAPKNTLFLGYFGLDAGFIHKARYGLFFWNHAANRFVSTGLIHGIKTRGIDVQPTHWMPLPNPPEETK